VAFAFGALTRQRPVALLPATAALITAVLAYYGAISFDGDRPKLDLQPATRASVLVALVVAAKLPFILLRQAAHQVQTLAMSVIAAVTPGRPAAIDIVVQQANEAIRPG
jgi:hypothetical protein